MLRTPAFADKSEQDVGYPVETSNGSGFVVHPEFMPPKTPIKTPIKTPAKATTEVSLHPDAMNDADFEYFLIRAAEADKMNAKPHKKQHTTDANTPPKSEDSRYEFTELLEDGTLALDGKQWRCKTDFVDVVVEGVRQVFKCSDLTTQKFKDIQELNKLHSAAAPGTPTSKQQRDPPKSKGKHPATPKADWESPSESDEELPPVGSSTHKLKPFKPFKAAASSLCPPKKKAKTTGAIHIPGHAELCENSAINKGLKGTKLTTAKMKELDAAKTKQMKGRNMYQASCVAHPCVAPPQPKKAFEVFIENDGTEVPFLMESVLKEIRLTAEKNRLDLQNAAEAAQEARIREAAVKAAKNPNNATTSRKLSAAQQLDAAMKQHGGKPFWVAKEELTDLGGMHVTLDPEPQMHIVTEITMHSFHRTAQYEISTSEFDKTKGKGQKMPLIRTHRGVVNSPSYEDLTPLPNPRVASSKANPFKYAKSGTGGFTMEYIKDKIELYESGGKGQSPQDLMDVRKARYNASVSGGGGASSSSA